MYIYIIPKLVNIFTLFSGCNIDSVVSRGFILAVVYLYRVDFKVFCLIPVEPVYLFLFVSSCEK